MVIRSLISMIDKELSENSLFEARQIVMYAMSLNSTELLLKSGEEISDNIKDSALKMAKRRKNGEPLQYIIGTAEFMGLEFKVNPSVLIPRADTETLVETVLGIIGNKKVRVLDIGTGSGCIGISIAKFNPLADVTFLDVSSTALSVAKENAKANDVKGKFIQMDILNEYPHEAFDVIVSNPPYIKSEVIPSLQTEVKDYEPKIALNGGDDGLVFYRRIISVVPRILKKGGLLAFEIGYDQGNDVKNLMSGFNDVQVVKDYCGNDRVVTGFSV